MGGRLRRSAPDEVSDSSLLSPPAHRRRARLGKAGAAASGVVRPCPAVYEQCKDLWHMYL